MWAQSFGVHDKQDDFDEAQSRFDDLPGSRRKQHTDVLQQLLHGGNVYRVWKTNVKSKTESAAQISFFFISPGENIQVKPTFVLKHKTSQCQNGASDHGDGSGESCIHQSQILLHRIYKRGR